MKKHLAHMGIGAAVGAGLLLLFWLLGDVAHIIGLTLEESAFFIGLVLFLVSLLLLVRGGPSAKYTSAIGHPHSHGVQASINPTLASQKEPHPPKDAAQVRMAPYVCMGAGLLDLLIALALMYL